MTIDKKKIAGIVLAILAGLAAAGIIISVSTRMSDIFVIPG